MNDSLTFPAVAIKCLVYNQQNYLRQMLDGIVMQRTNFPFVAIVHDDASTDDSANIIREYAEKWPNIIHPIFEVENQWSKKDGSLFKITNEAVIATKAKYVALCEGDDYWTDDQKLQKQYDLMESSPDCSLCFHSIMEIYENNPSRNKLRAQIDHRVYTGLEWYKTRPSQTASFFFRMDIYKTELLEYIYTDESGFLAKDVPLLICCSKIGKIVGIPDVMSVYRHNEGGWTAQRRSDSELLKIIYSQLAYSIFGEDFKKLAIGFYQDECIQAFLANLKRGNFKPKYLLLSLKKSFWGTFRSLKNVIGRRF